MNTLSLLGYSLLFQLIGFAAGVAISDPVFGMLAHTAIALCGAWLFSLPLAWMILNAALPLLLFFPTLDSWIPATGISILLLVYLPTLWTKVPYYPSNRKVAAIIKAELPPDHPFEFADFGSGFSGVICQLSAAFPNGKFTGYELGIIPFLVSYLRALPRPNVSIKLQSFWKPSWDQFDFIYTFLSPEPMPAIEDAFLRNGKMNGTLIVNSFPLPESPTKKVVDAAGQRLYFYRK